MTRPVESYRFTERILQAEKDLQQELLNTSLELLPGGCIRKAAGCCYRISTSGKEDGDTVIIRMKSLGIYSGESGWNREESSLTRRISIYVSGALCVKAMQHRTLCCEVR